MAQVDSENSTATPADPIYGAIAAHQEAYAHYDKTLTDSAPNDENRAAFRALDKACRRLVLAEASTLAGLIALLRYMAPLLQEEDAPALPLEAQFDSGWETAFGSPSTRASPTPGLESWSCPPPSSRRTGRNTS